jgi:hypothetical protein
MTAHPARLARRSIPVVVPVPMQLSLPLRWDQPMDRLAADVDPEPAPVVIAQRQVAA